MTLIKIITQDGSPVEFEYIDPVPAEMKGAQKNVYWHPQKQYVAAFYHGEKTPFTPNDKERVRRIVGEYYIGIFDAVGGEYWKKVFCWPRKQGIIEHNGRTGIVVPAYDTCYRRSTDSFLTPLAFNKLPQEEKGDLLRFLRICLHLARAVRRLHAAGLSHSDLSQNNCRIDPKGGNACIIDCDSLVVPGLFPPGVNGTPGFIAPEVLMNKGMPCKETDRHALAVLIYSCLFHRHPLEGDGNNTYDDEGELTAQAIFIEHPVDKSNRYQVGGRGSSHRQDTKKMPWIDTSQLPYSVLGQKMKVLFERAFIDGLHNPARRPSANDWEVALIATMEMVLPCPNSSCAKQWFVFDDSAARQRCPYCGTPFKNTVPILDFYTSDRNQPLNKQLVVRDQLALHQWHSSNLSPNEKLTDAQKKRVGRFRLENNKWMLYNRELPGMKNITIDKDIPLGQGVELTNGLQLLLQPGTEGRIAKVNIANQ